MTDIDPHTGKSLEAWMARWMAEELGVDASTIDPGRPFLSYGLNSVQAMMLVGDLETSLGRPLPPTLVWDHPTIEALAGHLVVAATPAAVAAPAGAGPPSAGPGLNSEGPEALLARLGELSEDQVDELLKIYMS